MGMLCDGIWNRVHGIGLREPQEQQEPAIEVESRFSSACECDLITKQDVSNSGKDPHFYFVVFEIRSPTVVQTIMDLSI